ncbi:MAG: class I SAM-dependent methyltransferase [Pirellulaceae bacterium]
MSLKRTLEPEVMASENEARTYDQMDHSAVNQIFVDDLLAAGFAGGDVLDLGTGTAQIPVLLAQHHDTCRIMAVDLSTEMLNLARYNLELGNVTQRVQLAQVDAKKMNFENGMFDAAISNSIIHHLPDPLTCLQEAVRVTRSGGLLFFRDLMRPETESTLESLVRTYVGHEVEYAQQLFRESLHAALSLDEIQGLVEHMGFRRDSVVATTDRHWTWIACKSAQD